MLHCQTTFFQLKDIATMESILRTETSEVKISADAPIVIIGEKINPTGRKKLAAALKDGEFDRVRSLATKQVAAGADILDVNVGVPGLDEVELLPEVVKIVISEVDVPLCLDSVNPAALSAALAVTPGKPLVNSVNGEEKSLQAVLPVVKEYNAAVIGLTMDDDGIPNDPEKRVMIAEKILERASKLGVPAEDVVIDPLVLTVGADQLAGTVTLRTIELLRKELGVNINLGASNVSFGLPERHTINEAFLALAAGLGANCVISDPMKHTLAIRAIDLLLGRDAYGARYIGHFRKISKE
jgi:5-methyltetrahydrofolate--homocysteine methyltransferase